MTLPSSVQKSMTNGMTIDGARQAIASGKTKATTLAESFYQTIAAEDPKINAWLSLSRERATAQAERVDAMVWRRAKRCRRWLACRSALKMC